MIGGIETTRAWSGKLGKPLVLEGDLTSASQRRQVPAWIDHYNREAPHSALNMQSPVEVYAAW